LVSKILYLLKLIIQKGFTFNLQPSTFNLLFFNLQPSVTFSYIIYSEALKVKKAGTCKVPACIAAVL